MLDMQGIAKIFRTDLIETHALRNFDLKVEAGEFVAVTGPSGSGKTTFLNIAGLSRRSNTAHTASMAKTSAASATISARACATRRSDSFSRVSI